MMPASQLSLDDLMNVGQALVKYNSLNIPQAIKLILGWDVFFWSASPEFSGGMTCVLPTNFGAEGPLVTAGEGFEYLGSKIFLAPLGKNATEHQQLH